jgi:hypothetical protein
LSAFSQEAGNAAVKQSPITFGKSLLGVAVTWLEQKSYLAHAPVFLGSVIAREGWYFAYLVNRIADRLTALQATRRKNA